MIESNSSVDNHTNCTCAEDDMLTFRPLRVGLTGSIGMGKSSISKQFKALGFRVFDADAAVHKLYSKSGSAGDLLAPHFPSAVQRDGSVDRNVLSSQVLTNPTLLKVLESIVHPLVAAEREEFYEEACKDNCLAVIYDIPLLLEQRDKHDIDYVVVVTASPETQRTRVLSRPNMTNDKFEAILSKQMPDSEKRLLADFIIDTDYPGFGQAKSQVARFVERIIEENPKLFENWKRRKHHHATSLANDKSYIKQKFDMVVFDLDDTLVPVMGPIQEANRAMHQFVNNNMATSSSAIHNDYHSTSQSVMEEHPLIAHDYTDIRNISLTKLCEDNQDDIDMVDKAVEVFVSARSNVDAHLYLDSIPCLRHISSQNVDIGLFTNGNAVISENISKRCVASEEMSKSEKSNMTSGNCSTLSSFLSLSLNAGDVGAQKPSIVPFVAISQRSGIPPSRILYVGDNYEHDVVAAKRANFTTAWQWKV